MKVIAVTGSNGFIGSHLVSHFSENGYTVYALQRNIPKTATSGNVDYLKYSIEQGFNEDDIKHCDAFVHCALVNYDNQVSDELNWNALKKIILFCRGRQAKLIYFSSMLAHERATSHYGTHKLLAEKMCDATKDLILKCGFVMSFDSGLFPSLLMKLSKKIIIPVSNWNMFMQSVDINELCQIVYSGIEKNISGSYPVGGKPFSMGKLYSTISKEYQYKNIFIKIPPSLTLFIARILENLGMKSTKWSSVATILLGKTNLIIYDTKEMQNIFGVSIRPFQETVSLLSKINSGSKTQLPMTFKGE